MGQRSSIANGGAQAMAGLVMALAGGAFLIWLLVGLYGSSKGISDAGFRLGLALSTLLSGSAQVMVLAGLWMVWRSFRRR